MSIEYPLRTLEMIILFIILKIPNLTGSPHRTVRSLTVKMSECASRVLSDSQSSSVFVAIFFVISGSFGLHVLFCLLLF